MSLIDRSKLGHGAWGKTLFVLAMSVPAAAVGARPLVSTAEPGEQRREGTDDRDVLVAACIDACDAVTSPAIRQRLLDALAEVGVTAVEVPAGTRFDPASHRAADTLMTEDDTLDGLVVETERLGFVDRGRRVRWPEVLVYQTTSDPGRADVA
jgi:molecular chaperone GrpE